MNARDLLEKLDDLGIGLTVAGDKIRYRSRGQPVPPELVAEMKSNRDELVGILTRRGQLRWPPVRDAGDGDRLGPLTRTQQTLWATNYFLDDGTYNLCGALRLRGRLDRAAFEAALEDVHDRHPSLRTVFPVQHGRPSQRILPQVAASLAVTDLTHLTTPDALDECLRDCALVADGKLPLDVAPPVHMRLYRLAREDHVFAVVLHHVIADAVSVRILIDDLARYYGARAGHGEMPPPPPDLDMIDFARWEEDRLRYADLGAVRRYWKERLAGAALGALPLPAPAGDPRADRRGAAAAATVDAATTAAVRELVSTTRSSVFIVVSAAISVMLSRYTGREDLVLGMPVHRRDRGGLEQLVGLLLDVVPVRLDVGGGRNFVELIQRTRSAILGAAGHAILPLDLIAGEHMRGNDAAGRALFNVVITDNGTRLPEPPFGDLEAREVVVPQTGAKFDLNFLIRDDTDTLHIDVEFSPQAISGPDVAAMTAMVRRILALGASNPGRSAADLASSPLAEAGPGAVGVAAVRAPEPGESLVSRLAGLAETLGGAAAVSHEDDAISYGTLARLADRVARGLGRQGVGAGDVVAVRLGRGIDLVIAILGVMRCGAACLVLDAAGPGELAARLAADAGARLVIGADTAASGARCTVSELADLGAGAAPCGPVPADAPACVIYASGETGPPRGVRITHRNVLSLLDGTGGEFGFGSCDTWTLSHPWSSGLFVWEMFGCLLHGGRLVVVPERMTRGPGAFARLLEREGVTVLNLTPAELAMMLPALATSGSAARGVRYLILAGEGLDRRLADRWYRAAGPGARVVTVYGAAETTGFASWAWRPPGGPGSPESDIGSPLPGTCMHLLHGNGAPVINRCVGEIYVAGPLVSLGYLGEPRETACRFVPDPFSSVPGARMYRSGDLGRRDGSGVRYLGRRERGGQVSGLRVELSDIEAVLAREPGVALAAAAFAVDPDGVVAAVVPDDGAQVSARDLLQAARAGLPRYMVPRAIAVAASLPLTAGGKVDRAGVAALAAADATSRAEPVAPRTPAETLLLALYREVLEDGPASSAADFFDSGGDSMRVIRLVSLARDQGLHFTVGDVYAAPGLTELAGRATFGPAGPDAADRQRPPFSLLPAGLGDGFPDDVQDAYPMTALQTGMMFHRELAPDSPVYHIVLSYRVGGTMEPGAFLAAVRGVMDAHPILRTSFDLSHRAGPVQRVHARVAPPLTVEDLRQLGRAGQEDRIREVIATQTATEFDVAQAPLLRLVVLILSDGEYQLVFPHHHAILDGWSVNVFFEDLLVRYTALAAGRPADPIPRLRTSFADYVALEGRAINDPADRDFWQARVSSDAHLIAPARSGPPLMRQLRTGLPDDMLGRLRAVAGKVKVPLKVLLLAAHVRVVAWLSGNDEVVTGLTMGCRPEQPDSDRVLGLFLNELPMRLRLDGQSWAELARQVHLDEQEMMRHRWYPHASIQRHPSQPIFDSYFNFTDFHNTRRLVHDGSIQVLGSYELESTHYAFGTNYTIDVQTGELRLILEYDESAVTRPTAALAAEAHRRILTAITADPQTPCRSTALPGAVDLARLVADELGRTDRGDENGSGPARSSGGRPGEPPRPRRQRATDQDGGPLTPLERSVQEAWTEVLGPGSYGRHTSFFDVGGSSLNAMQVVSRLRARHGKLSLGAFMNAPTIFDIAAGLSTSPGTSAGLAAPSPAAHPSGVSDGGTAGHGPLRYPLSGAQQQMWLVASRLPGVPLFGMPGALRADGPLDLDVLERTFASLLRRHESLRTRIEATAAGAEQVVEPHATLGLQVVDVSRYREPAARCEALMAAAVRDPIPLDSAPLMRATVYRIGADQHVIYVNIHHIVCDGWSLALLLDEATRTYRIIAAGAGPEHEPAPVGGGQLAMTRHEWLATADAQDQRAYWADRLAPPWSSLADGPSSRFGRRKQGSFIEGLRSATCRRSLPGGAIEAVSTAARRHGMTEFMVVLAAYAGTLRAWSDQDDVRIATMVANRAEPGTEDTVGLLANTVLLRMQVGAEAGLADLSRQARRVCLEAFEHEDLPFEEALASLESRYPAGQRGGPIFEVMLVMQEQPGEAGPADGLSLTPYPTDGGVLDSPVAATTCEFILVVTAARGELVLQYKPATTTKSDAIALLDDICAAIVAAGQALEERP